MWLAAKYLCSRRQLHLRRRISSRRSLRSLPRPRSFFQRTMFAGMIESRGRGIKSAKHTEPATSISLQGKKHLREQSRHQMGPAMLGKHRHVRLESWKWCLGTVLARCGSASVTKHPSPNWASGYSTTISVEANYFTQFLVVRKIIPKELEAHTNIRGNYAGRPCRLCQTRPIEALTVLDPRCH